MQNSSFNSTTSEFLMNYQTTSRKSPFQMISNQFAIFLYPQSAPQSISAHPFSITLQPSYDYFYTLVLHVIRTLLRKQKQLNLVGDISSQNIPAWIIYDLFGWHFSRSGFTFSNQALEKKIGVVADDLLDYLQ